MPCVFTRVTNTWTALDLDAQLKRKHSGRAAAFMMHGGYVWENISRVMELRCVAPGCVVAGGAAGKKAPEEEEIREA